MTKETKAIFLDRDGVINKEVNYLSNPDDFELLDGTIEALKIFKRLGYLLIVITNQSGLARGYFDLETLNQIHKKMEKNLLSSDVKLDSIYFCPHHPEFTGECSCRKPKPGLLFTAKEDFSINLNQSFMVGDALSDIKAGKNANVKTVLVLSGHGKKTQIKLGEIQPDFIFNNLLEFAKYLKRQNF